MYRGRIGYLWTLWFPGKRRLWKSRSLPAEPCRFSWCFGYSEDPFGSTSHLHSYRSSEPSGKGRSLSESISLIHPHPLPCKHKHEGRFQSSGVRYLPCLKVSLHRQSSFVFKSTGPDPQFGSRPSVTDQPPGLDYQISMETGQTGCVMQRGKFDPPPPHTHFYFNVFGFSPDMFYLVTAWRSHAF